MDGGGGRIEEEPVEPEAPAMLPAVRRGRGRPRGTTYERRDRPYHEEMRRLLEDGVCWTITAPARTVSPRAYPPGPDRTGTKERRLVRSYPWPHPESSD